MLRARQDPQRRRRRPPRDGQDVARRGAPLPDGRDQPARGGRGRHDGVRLRTRTSTSAQHARSRCRSTHTSWQDRKINLVDVPGDPAFQGELRCARARRRGSARRRSPPSWASRWAPPARGALADELGLARVVFVNMLDRERADFFRTLEQLRDAALDAVRRRAHPDRRRARAVGHRRRAPHVRLHEPRTAARRASRARSRTRWPSSPPSTARSSSTRSSRPTRR